MGFIPAREDDPFMVIGFDYSNLPVTHLKSEKTENDIRTRIYQLNVIHKKIADPLNVVIISKKNVQTGKVAHVILFSTDLELEWEKILTITA